MKIGFDAKRAFHNFRGLGNYSRTLIGNLCRYYPEHEYFAYTPDFKDKRALPWQQSLPQLKIIRPNSFIAKKIPSLWRSNFLAEILRKDKIDVYHGLHHELPAGINRSAVKTVVTVHDVLFLRYPQFHGKLNCYIYTRKLRHSCQVADVVIAISDQTRQDLIDFLQIPAEKIKVVYQSCHDAFFEPVTSEQIDKVKYQYSLPENYLFYIGALTESKNLKNLLQSFIMLASKNPDLHLVLAGEGKLKAELQQMAKASNLAERVLFLGFINNDLLPALYRGARVFVFPSLFEGFGIPIIEALASGTPVITTQGSCFPEAGGPLTKYVDPQSVPALAEVISDVLESEALRQEMIAAGQQYVQKFRPEVVTKEIMNVYKGLVA